MTKTAIRIAGLWKEYALGRHQRSDTFYELLSRAVSAPFRRFRDLSGRLSEQERIWALRDLSLVVSEGEVLGVIGPNGAGKSTLLKVLTRITEPTRGRATIRGRVASLLEVGTGFHPELTGRENVYLNGAILGMTRREIALEFDAIVAFAEVERFLDTPVKRYSSGMYVRLAFSVAAHLRPDVLLVDEVLAVGDASFQKKCLAKMGEVRNLGRTILFVSHNMTAVHQLCSRAVLIENGSMTATGPVDAVVSRYLDSGAGSSAVEWPVAHEAPGNERIRLHAIRILSRDQIRSEVPIDQPLRIEVEFWNFEENLRDLCVNVYILDALGSTVLSTANTEAASSLKTGWFHKPHDKGLYRASCTFPPNFFNSIHYKISVYVVTLSPLRIEAAVENSISFTVHDTGALREAGLGGEWHGVVRPALPWETEAIGDLPSAGRPPAAKAPPVNAR